MKRSGPRSQRKLRNLVLDRPFQFKYTLAVVLITVALTAGMGAFVYQAQREASRITLMVDEDMAEIIGPELAKEDRKVLWALGLFLLLETVTLGVLGVVVTHHIVGPAGYLTRLVRQVANGKLPKARPIRKGDEFRDLAGALADMLDRLRQQETEDLNRLEMLADCLERGDGGCEEARAWLEQIVERKKARLEVVVNPPDLRQGT